ncbi:zincin-like metallopeptidase domain-containing protein (plasmid) [Phocaeicola vulgatus]|nr:zincin-like metallopeptidase domain-containing protein [Phocaeicola vulgatus]
MPLRSQFVDMQSFYETLLHEMGHSTGHPTRLNRDLAHPFGSEEYGKEELTAEFAAHPGRNVFRDSRTYTH